MGRGCREGEGGGGRTAELKHVLVVFVDNLIGRCALRHSVLLEVRLKLGDLVFDVVGDVADVHPARANRARASSNGQI